MKRKRDSKFHTGVDAVAVLNGMIGTIALSIKTAGGDNRDCAEIFRSVAESYEQRAKAEPRSTQT